MTNTNSPAKSSLSKDQQIIQAHKLFSEIFVLKKSNKGRSPNLRLSDIATITLIQSRYQIKTLKSLHTFLSYHYSNMFKLPAYQNFVISMNKNSMLLLQLMLYTLKINKNKLTKIKFIDSTPVPVCKIYRSSRHKTMKLLASKKKSTTGWFYGLKLHLMCDLKYNLTCFEFTTGSADDREVLDSFLNKIKFTNSILVADAGYVSKEYEVKAYKTGTYLLTVTRKNMKTLITAYNNSCLNLRSKVETVFSILKDRFRLITSIPRSINGYLAHYLRTLFMYVFNGLLIS